MVIPTLIIFFTNNTHRPTILQCYAEEAGRLYFQARTTMITHRIEIQVCRTSGRAFVYDVVDLETKQLWLKGAREPLTETARLLASLGASDQDRVEMYRPGHHGWDMRGSIGYLKGKTTREDDKTSVKWVEHRPHPST